MVIQNDETTFLFKVLKCPAKTFDLGRTSSFLTFRHLPSSFLTFRHLPKQENFLNVAAVTNVREIPELEKV